MKRSFLLSFFIIFFVLPLPVFATFIDNNTNLSAEWTRMQARVGSNDSMDSITYNPAGTVNMENGFYLSLQNQFLPKSYSHEYNNKKYEADNTTLLVPGLFAMNKKGKWSQFAGINVIGGGGSLIYDSGIFSKTPYGVINVTPGKKSEYTSAYMGALAGGAYKINKNLSLSLAGRFVYALNSLEMEDGDLLKLEKTAKGFAPIIGLNYIFNSKLNLGLRHEFKTSLEFEIDELSGPMKTNMEASGINKGDKNRRDFPALTAIGVSYMLRPDLKIAADFNYCWNEDVKWSQDKKGDNSWEAAIGIEYALNDVLKISSGYSYVDAGLDVEDYSTTIGKNPYHLLAGGFELSPKKNMKLNFGVSKLFYKDMEDELLIKYEKDLWIIGAGMEVRFN